MHIRQSVVGGIVLLIVITAVIWSVTRTDRDDTQHATSPCTGAELTESALTPCVVATHTIPENGQGFTFHYPDNSGVEQSSLDVATVERSTLDDVDNPLPLGPYYLITLYYNDNVSIDAFNAMFKDGKADVLAGKSVIKSTEALFPNPEYPYATAYYINNNGKDAIAIVAGYDSDMLIQAEAIFEDGFSWEDTATAVSPFDFVLKYGVGAKNVLDTDHGTFTKDMIVDPSITIPLTLTHNELDAIHARITALNIFADSAVTHTTVFTTPCESYDLVVEENGKTSHASLNCEAQETNLGLKTLGEEIRAIIEEKEEYKKLPEPQGGYL